MASSKKNNKDVPEQKPQKSHKLILQHTEEAALTQLNRKSVGLFLSGISAGLDIGFSVLLMTVALAQFKGVVPDAAVNFIVSNMYPIGFIFVVLGRSELFTEHTTLAVLPVLQGLAPLIKLFRLWIIVYISNIIGGLIFALILFFFANTLHFLEPWALEQISKEFISYSGLTLILSATLAGWMMGLLAWLVAASRETVSQILIIWIVTASIGFAGLSHCIVGNIETAASLFIGKISFQQYISFLAPVTLGNALGGVLFVGILKYSHIAFSGTEEEIDIEKSKAA